METAPPKPPRPLTPPPAPPPVPPAPATPPAPPRPPVSAVAPPPVPLAPAAPPDPLAPDPPPAPLASLEAPPPPSGRHVPVTEQGGGGLEMPPNPPLPLAPPAPPPPPAPAASEPESGGGLLTATLPPQAGTLAPIPAVRPRRIKSSRIVDGFIVSKVYAQNNARSLEERRDAPTRPFGCREHAAGP